MSGYAIRDINREREMQRLAKRYDEPRLTTVNVCASKNPSRELMAEAYGEDR